MGLSNAELGLVLTTVAGSATALGAAVVFSERLVQLASKPFLAGALGLSSGVMLYVSFVEIFVKSLDGFADSSAFGDSDAYLMATAALFGGMAFMSGLDALVHWLDPNRSAHHASDPRKHMVSIAASFFLRCLRRWRGCGVETCLGHPNVSRRWRMSRDSHRREARTSTLTPPPRHRRDAVLPSREPHECTPSTRRVTRHATQADPAPDLAPCCELDDGVFDEIERRRAAAAAGAPDQPDEPPKADDTTKDKRLESMGMMTALAIGIHNFPEGLATFVATLDDPAVGASLAIAIAIHNIPEGLCVSIPIYFATGDRWKAFRWALLSGVSEIVGALLGWALLKDHFDNLLYGIVFGLVAGMMIMICLNELIPTAHRYDPRDRVVTKSIVAGMAVMAASLCLFVYG